MLEKAGIAYHVVYADDAAGAAFAVAMIVAYAGGGLPIVATVACAVVFIVELFI